MKRLYTVILVIGLSGALFAAGPKGDWKQGPQDGPPKDGKGMMVNIVKDLDLNKDQLEKVEQLRKDQEKDGRKLGKELRNRHQALRKELAKSEINDDRVNGIVNQLADDQKKMLLEHVKYAKEYKKILTPEQQKKLNDHIDKMEKQMQERHAGEGLMGGMMGGPKHR